MTNKKRDDQEEGHQVEAPLAEFFDFAGAIPSLSRDQASYSMHTAHVESVLVRAT